MAFSLQKFTDNPKVGVQDTLEVVTPRQIQQLSTDLTETLKDTSGSFNNLVESIAGIDLQSQFPPGKQMEMAIERQLNNLLGAFEAQLLGCVNKAVVDALNKNPSLQKILFFEQFVNQKLSEFRNRLETEIDRNLRKLAYQKIKIHQVVIFKQKALEIIRSICPDATPASPIQVNRFNQTLSGVFKKNQDAGKVADQGITIPKDTPKPVNVSVKRAESVSPRTRKRLKEDEDFKLKEIEARKKQLTQVIKDQANTPPEIRTWEQYA